MGLLDNASFLLRSREVPFHKIGDESEQAKKCGFTTDRNYNAVMNILKSGLVRPVEPVNTYDHQRGGRFEEAPYSVKSPQKKLSQGKSFL